jgi:hypothetical protein
MLVVPPVVSVNAHESTLKIFAKSPAVRSSPLRATNKKTRAATAIIYCEANFGEIDGKTANGLIRRSEK